MNRYYTDEDKGITVKKGNRGSMAPAYFLVEHEDGSIHLQDGSHAFVVTKEEMLDLVHGMMKFIENDITDSEIEEHNSEILDREMSLIDRTTWKNEKSSSSNSKKEQSIRKSEGWVYFLKADNGLTKIGRTKDLEKRMYHFTVKMPYELELIYAIETEYTIELEAQLHEKYKHLNVRGEWFNLNEEIMAEIQSGY